MSLDVNIDRNRFFLDFPPLISEKLLEIGNKCNTPFSLAVTNLLGALSLASSGVIDVKGLAPSSHPTSLMLIAASSSGDRKTAVAKETFAAFIEWQKKYNAKHQEAMQEYEAQYEVWKIRKEAFKRQAVKKPHDKEVIATLTKHEGDKPKAPKKIQLIYDDITPEALTHNLYKNSSTAMLASDEGAGFLNGRVMSAMTTLNSLYSGSVIYSDRKTSDSFELKDARLTVSIATQPEPLKRFLADKGKLARETGLMARFLICEPISNQGYRHINYNQPEVVEKIESGFDKRVRELLDEYEYAVINNLPRKVLEFDESAMILLHNYYNTIESYLVPGNRLCNVKDHGSKLVENATRVAALIHYFVYGDSKNKIQHHTLELAIKICDYYSSEFVRIFDGPTEAQINADNIGHWLQNQIISLNSGLSSAAFWLRDGSICIKKNSILRNGPSATRKVSVLNDALSELINNRILWEVFLGKNVKCYILNRANFNYSSGSNQRMM